VPGGRAGQRGPRCDNRRFVDALLWMARSGGRWRDLPERFGDHQAVKRRYYRWIERGALSALEQNASSATERQTSASDKIATLKKAQENHRLGSTFSPDFLLTAVMCLATAWTAANPFGLSLAPRAMDEPTALRRDVAEAIRLLTGPLSPALS
jgi:transposase